MDTSRLGCCTSECTACKLFWSGLVASATEWGTMLRVRVFWGWKSSWRQHSGHVEVVQLSTVGEMLRLSCSSPVDMWLVPVLAGSQLPVYSSATTVHKRLHACSLRWSWMAAPRAVFHDIDYMPTQSIAAGRNDVRIIDVRLTTLFIAHVLSHLQKDNDGNPFHTWGSVILKLLLLKLPAVEGVKRKGCLRRNDEMVLKRMWKGLRSATRGGRKLRVQLAYQVCLENGC